MPTKATRSLSDADRRILRVLQRQGDISNLELAQTVGLSPSPCLRRVRRLREGGVIRSVVALVDLEAVGLEVEAIATLSLSDHGKDSLQILERELNVIAEVISAWQVTGRSDLVLRIVAPNLKSYAASIQRIAGLKTVNSMESFVVLRSVKDHSPLPV